MLIGNFPQLRFIIYENPFTVELFPGQSYIVDNHRFLHSRTSFNGTRELLRVLAHPHPAKTCKFILFDVDGTICRS
jgi:alpha-ketoglutarate-dependent taurine dioxygenase